MHHPFSFPSQELDSRPFISSTVHSFILSHIHSLSHSSDCISIFPSSGLVPGQADPVCPPHACLHLPHTQDSTWEHELHLLQKTGLSHCTMNSHSPCQTSKVQRGSLDGGPNPETKLPMTKQQSELLPAGLNRWKRGDPHVHQDAVDRKKCVVSREVPASPTTRCSQQSQYVPIFPYGVWTTRIWGRLLEHTDSFTSY